MKNIFKRLFGLFKKKDEYYFQDYVMKVKKYEPKEWKKEKPTQTIKASEVNQTTQSDTFNQWKDIVIRDND